jgi:two-component system NtrC family sensor kinase
LGSKQVELLPRIDTVAGRPRSADGSQLQAAVLGQAHWTAVGKLTPGLIHEFNNALCVIGNYVQLLTLERERRGWDIVKPLAAMSNSLERARALTHRVATYVREKAQPASFVRVNELLEEALTFASLQRQFRELELRTAFGDNLPEVEGDPRSLMDAFVELLTIDSQPVARGGAVAISTRSTPGWVTVTLSGPDRAWPCPEASLTLARQIIEQQGGRLVREADPGPAAGNISVWLRASTDTVAAQAA